MKQHQEAVRELAGIVGITKHDDFDNMATDVE
jgi:hypothetical protein